MGITPLFRDRSDAGVVLVQRLSAAIAEADLLVLALPRGGVPVGFEVARVMHAELDVFLIRKLGLPGQEELAVGAIASGGVRVLNHDLVEQLRLPEGLINRIALREQQELTRRERLYRENRAAPAIRDRTVLLVDDGLATGASMLAASRALRAQNPKRVIVAVPVASRQACEDLRREVDEVICAATPDPFIAVGVWYEDFSQTSDREVRRLLDRAAREAIR